MDFWKQHDLLFLFGCVFFPRITTLFFTSVSFGLLHILGWIFAPHLLVAILATTYYWDTNPMLCIIAWICAFGGTAAEEEIVRRNVK